MKTKELENMLNELRGATFVNIVATTNCRLPRKTGYKDAVKVQNFNATINFHYENSVNNQRIREGKQPVFEAMERTWGKRRLTEDNRLTPLVDHDGKVYLECKIEKIIETKYFMYGKEIEASVIEPLLRESTASRQGLEKEVVLRDYDLDNINTITINSKTYIVNG